MQTVGARDIVTQYIDAFNAQDLQRCVDLYDEQASLEFGPATYQGRKNLESWHRTRFGANLRLVRVDDISDDGDTIVIDAVITSSRLKALRIGTLAGRATFQVRDGKIVDARFGLGSADAHEAIRLQND